MAKEGDGFYSIWLKRVEGLHRTILKRYFCIVSLLDDKGGVLHQNITHSFATSIKPNIGVRFILPNFPNAREIRIDIARMHKGAGVRRLKSKYLVLASTTFSLNLVRTCDVENGCEYFEFSQSDEFHLSFTSDKDVPFTENVDDNLDPLPLLQENSSVFLSIKKLLNLPANYQLASKFKGAQHTWHAVSNRPGRLFQRGTLDLVFNIPHEFNSFKKVKILVRTDTQFLSFPYDNKVTAKVAKYCGIQQEDLKYENPRCTFVLFQHQYPKSVEITLLCSTKKLTKENKKYRFLLDLHSNQWKDLPSFESHDILGTSLNLYSLDPACDQIPNFDFSVSSYVRLWDENNLENHWGKNDSILTEEFYCEYEFAFSDNFADRFHTIHSKEILDSVCVLFVRGLMCNYYATYYLENLKRVSDLGLLHEEVKIDTNKGCATNAKTIQTFILAKANEFKEQGKNYKFIIFAHSKGVADLHVALATYPEIRPLLYGVIAMQGVHYGTPSYETFQMGRFQSAVESILKGESEAFLDLSYNIRSKFAEEFPFPQEVSAISLATVFKSDYGPELDNPLFDKAYSVCAKQIRKRTGYESDGLVIQADARVPNSDIILLEEMCHSHVASQFPGAKYTPGPITQTVISLLLRKVEGLSALFTGKIDIIIESADNLAPKDAGNTSDPFVVVLKDNVKLFQTQIIKKTLNPLWNYRGSIRFSSMDSVLKFNCWDHDLLSNDFEGRVKITFAELLSGVEVGSDEYVKKSYSLEPKSNSSKNEEITGIIHLSVRYTTNQSAMRASSPIVVVQ